MSGEQTTAQKLQADEKEADLKATEIAREMIAKRNRLVDKLYQILIDEKVNYSDFMHVISPALIDKVNNFIVTRDIADYEITEQKAQELKRRQQEALSK